MLLHFKFSTSQQHWQATEPIHARTPLHPLISKFWECGNTASNGTAVCNVSLMRQGADKSLARPGRKQFTGAKLGIYSTYSQRSSINLLACWSNLCKPLKKFQKFVRPTRSTQKQWPLPRTKNCNVWIVFSAQGTGGSATGPDPENSVGDQDIGSLGNAGSSELQMPGEKDHCLARTRPHGWPYRGLRFAFKTSFNCTSRDK